MLMFRALLKFLQMMKSSLEKKVDQIMNTPVSSSNNSTKNKSSDEFVKLIEPNENSPTFRVQRSFNRKIKKSILKDIPNVGIKGDDGLYRFFSDPTDKSQAASHKVDLTLTGYNDAFIVAFQNGKRITLKEAGFEVKKDFLKILIILYSF